MEAEGWDDRDRLEVGLGRRALAALERERALEEADQLARPVVAPAEDGEVQLVVADHVDVVAAADQPRARREMRGTAGGGVGEGEGSQLPGGQHRGGSIADLIRP